jgi:hypothetical protein
VGAGGQALDPVGIFNLPFTWTDKEGRFITVLNEVIDMKKITVEPLWYSIWSEKWD